MDQTVVTYFFYGVTYALIIAVLTLCIMALRLQTASRPLRAPRHLP